jgi:hypothetical protein
MMCHELQLRADRGILIRDAGAYTAVVHPQLEDANDQLSRKGRWSLAALMSPNMQGRW